MGPLPTVPRVAPSAPGNPGTLQSRGSHQRAKPLSCMLSWPAASSAERLRARLAPGHLQARLVISGPGWQWRVQLRPRWASGEWPFEGTTPQWGPCGPKDVQVRAFKYSDRWVVLGFSSALESCAVRNARVAWRDMADPITQRLGQLDKEVAEVQEDIKAAGQKELEALQGGKEQEKVYWHEEVQHLIGKEAKLLGERRALTDKLVPGAHRAMMMHHH